MKSSPEQLELQFLRAFKDYIYHFNMLERNVVYCLAHATGGKDFSLLVKKFSSISFDEKMRRLKKIIEKKGWEKAFSDCFDSVDQIRMMRNRIVHGQWEIHWYSDPPIRFDVSAPEHESGSMSLEEFASKLDFLRKAADDFGRLRRDYDIRDKR